VCVRSKIFSAFSAKNKSVVYAAKLLHILLICDMYDCSKLTVLLLTRFILSVCLCTKYLCPNVYAHFVFARYEPC